MQRIIHNLIGLVFACVFFACNSEESTRPKNLLLYDFCKLSDEQSSGKWTYNGSKVDDAFTGEYVSQISNENPIGIKYESNFTSALNRHNLQLVYHGRIRTNNIKSCGEFVFKVVHNDSTLFEKHCDNKRFIKKEKEWTFFCDTVIITQNFSSDSLNKLNIIFHHTGGESVVEADDIHLKIFDIHNYSFLPKTPPAIESSAKSKTLLQNNFFKINYDEENQTINLNDIKNETLSKQITYLLEYKTNRNDTLLPFSFQKFKVLKQEKNTIEFTATNKIISVQIKIELDSSTQLHFSIKRDYHQNIFVGRESIVIETNDKVCMVYRSNRQVDTQNFQDEYWLEKEGVKIGKNERSINFYHNEDITSAQLNTLQNQLIINLDYAADHPFTHFPLIENPTQEVRIDLSERERKANTSASNSWNLFIGQEVNSLPRFMKSNDGYISTYIFTEHADNTDIRTHRAVNYGSEEITNYNSARGGFAKYDIPNTKSIFYNNPTHSTNERANKNFTTEVCNLKGSSDFEKMVDELYANGQEICLHTPDNSTTTAKNLKEALEYMAKKYHSKSWIDHGYNNRLKDNREDFVCDGLSPSSPYYALELWQKNNIKYLWNCQNEHSWIHTQYHFQNSLTDVYYGWGDRLPSPSYWLESNASNKVYSWSTNQHFALTSPQQWNELYNEKTLNDLIANQGICINHCYTASVDENSVSWYKNEKGKIVIRPEFDEALKLLAHYRDQKLLNITTVEKFMDYNLAVEKVKYEIIGEGTIRITNTSNTNIKGLSMIVKAKKISAKGKNISSKKWNGELVFWFDLGAGESVMIEYN
jgi:hypothetical protein